MEKLAFSTSPILLAAIRHEKNQASNLNINLICQDRSVVLASGLVMGAICPVLRKIGKTESEFEHLDVFLPDLSSDQVRCFLKVVVSEKGPESVEEQATFTELLNFFAKEPTTSTCNLTENFCMKNEEGDDTLELPSLPLPPVPGDLPENSLDNLLDWEETFNAVDAEFPNICDEDIPLKKIHKSKRRKKSKEKKSVPDDDGEPIFG